MTNLPEAFVEFVTGYPQLAILQQSLQQSPVTSIRLNTSKTGNVPPLARGCDTDRVKWCADGVYLGERPQFTFDPLLHQGAYYVQDASSMAIGCAVRQITGTRPVTYLDACAAPGGKTTCAMQYLPAGSLVTANELDHRRASILQENVAKWGTGDVVVTRGDTARLRRLGRIFDIVAVDAPCSGEGMMRKDPQAVAQWSPRLIDSCAGLQRQIVDNVIPCIKPGGYLIYSTCTFNLNENEDNVRWMIEERGLIPEKIDMLECVPEVEKGIGCDFPCYRFIPGKVKGEGLFMALLRTPDTNDDSKTSNKPSRTGKIKTVKECAGWIKEGNEVWTDNNEVWAASAANAQLVRLIASALDTLSQGVHVASVKGKDIVPCHELALSTILRREAFANIDLPLDEAVRFLQRGNVTLPDGTPKGFVLLTYDTLPLGFVKNIGNRSNNLLPKQWRILSRL